MRPEEHNRKIKGLLVEKKKLEKKGENNGQSTEHGTTSEVYMNS